MWLTHRTLTCFLRNKGNSFCILSPLLVRTWRGPQQYERRFEHGRSCMTRYLEFDTPLAHALEQLA